MRITWFVRRRSASSRPASLVTVSAAGYTTLPVCLDPNQAECGYKEHINSHESTWAWGKYDSAIAGFLTCREDAYWTHRLRPSENAAGT